MESQSKQEDHLFNLAMDKDWPEVVNIYTTNAWARTNKLTNSKDTTLHVAILSYQKHDKKSIQLDHVKKMIKSIPSQESYKTLAIKNNNGNTILHLAASVGWKDVCQLIASNYPRLIRERNDRKETPLFFAAYYCNLEAFICLHEIIKGVDGEPAYSLCRRDDGNTILHSAISGEHFELAYLIMKDYPKLMNSVNEVGESPLHVLAQKPNVFKSSSTLGLCDSIIYHCMPFDELNRKRALRVTKDRNSHGDAKYPANYQTCADILVFLGRPIVKSAKAGFKRCWSTCCHRKDVENQPINQNKVNGAPSSDENERSRHFPSNYRTSILLFKFGMKIILTILGLGFAGIKKTREKKQRHEDAFTIMKILIKYQRTEYRYTNDGQAPQLRDRTKTIPGFPLDISNLDSGSKMTSDVGEASMNHTQHRDEIEDQSDKKDVSLLKSIKTAKNDTPLLIAAKMGIPEMVTRILEMFPMAIHDVDADGKNALLLAAENRQTVVFKKLLSLNLPEYLFHKTDKDGNTILHLASKLGTGELQPWRIPGAALQMQWEIKWYKFVKRKIPRLCYAQRNNEGETTRKVFRNSHQKLIEEGTKWLIKTSESCSVVAALIATVAFATSATVPGGLNQETGVPLMENRTTFDVFSVSSLMALSLSVTALVFFLAIITSRCQESDFKSSLPSKLLMGLTALFMSIAAMLVSFCAGHTFILGNYVRMAAVQIYVIACVPVSLFALAQLPLYFDLVLAACKEVPVRSYKVHHH